MHREAYTNIVEGQTYTGVEFLIEPGILFIDGGISAWSKKERLIFVSTLGYACGSSKFS